MCSLTAYVSISAVASSTSVASRPETSTAWKSCAGPSLLCTARMRSERSSRSSPNADNRPTRRRCPVRLRVVRSARCVGTCGYWVVPGSGSTTSLASPTVERMERSRRTLSSLTGSIRLQQTEVLASPFAARPQSVGESGTATPAVGRSGKPHTDQPIEARARTPRISPGISGSITRPPQPYTMLRRLPTFGGTTCQQI